MKKSILLSCLVLLTLTGCSLKDVVEHGKTECDADYVVVSENLICRLNAEQKLSECSGHLHSIEVGYCPGGFDVCGTDESGTNFCHIACSDEQVFCDFQCVSSNSKDYCGARGNCNSDDETSDDFKGAKCDDDFSCVDGKCLECVSASDCRPPENAVAVCSDHTCSFNCSTGFVKTADGLGCEPFSCTKTDISGCTPPEHSTPFCQISACSDEDKDCVPVNTCDFFCDDGFIKSQDGLSCDAFVCDADNLTKCQDNLPEFAVASCFRNRCDFQCDASHVKLGNACVECSDDNASHCPSLPNASVSCSESKCQYACQDGCYSWDEKTKSCAMIDVNKNNVPDCYDMIDCDASNVICIKTADDFLHLPDYFDADGKIKSEYEGKYSGKDEYDVTFYLMNDINLNEVITTSADPVAKECHATSWNAPALKKLVLKTPLDSDKRIYYQYDFNGESVNCSMNSSLLKSLDNSKISHIKFEIDVAADEVHSVFAENMTNCELNDVSWKGTIKIPDNKDGANLGGIAGEAQNTKFRRVYCDGATIIASHFDAVGCVVGVMNGGDFSNESDNSSIPVTNRVETIVANRSVGGLMGELHQVAGIKSKVVVRHIQNQVDLVDGFENVGGLIGQISDAEVQNIDNSVNVVRGNQNVGGLIGNVNPVCLIHDVKNTINSAILGIEKDAQKYLRSFGGLIGSIYNNDANKESVLDAKVTEIYQIVQTAANDDVMVSADAYVGGFIGSINPNKYMDYEVSVHDISSQMPIVMGSINREDVGGFAGIGVGTSEHPLKISNVTNRVKTIKNSFAAAGFISTANYTDFENILNEFENVTCLGNCGGFLSRGEEDNFKNIINKNIVHEDDNFYGVQLVYNEQLSGASYRNIGVGGFVNLIRGRSIFENIENDIHSVDILSGIGVSWPAAGFIARANAYYYMGSVDFETISVKNVTNHVSELLVPDDKNYVVAGFASNARNIVFQNCLNRIGNISGGLVAGFAGSLGEADVRSTYSVIDQISFQQKFAGFGLSIIGRNNIFSNIMSLVSNSEPSSCTNVDSCSGSGFAFLDKTSDIEMINIVSLANIKMQIAKNVDVKYDMNGAIGFTGYDFIYKSDNPDDKYLFKNLVSFASIQLSFASNNLNKLVTDNQISSISFKPLDGSSLYYYAPASLYSAMPDVSKCKGMCLPFPVKKSVDDIVDDMNEGFKSLIWKKSKLKLGDQDVVAPALDLTNIGFIQPDGVIGYQQKD